MAEHKSWEEVKSELAAMKRSRWAGLKFRLREAWHWRRVPRWTWQRARRGYSDRDTWSLDSYICGVIGRALVDLRDNGHGHPGDVTAEEWKETLTRISEALLAYPEIFRNPDLSYEEEMARYEAAREAMHMVAENLGALWD